MRPELLHPADRPADDRPSPGDDDGPGTALSLVLALAAVAVLTVAPALLGPLAAAAVAVGLLVGLPLAVARAWRVLGRLRTRLRVRGDRSGRARPSHEVN